MAGAKVSDFNWGLLLVTLLLMGAGLVALYSATWEEGQVGIDPTFRRQLIYMGLGLSAMVATLMVDYRVYERLAWFIYGANCILLLVLLVMGRVVQGSQRWLDLGVGNLQPSETAKLALVIILAKYFHGNARPGGHRLRDLLRPLGLTLIPAILIFQQPDLGSTLFQVALFGILCLFARLRWKSVLMVVVAGLLIAPGAYFYTLNDYQRDRIQTFLNPERDPRGKGYQTIQARYAIGAGRIQGQGFLKGSQTHRGFIPEQHNDFIFTVLAEEWGLTGSATVLGLYLVMILMGLAVALQAKERFGVFLALGATAIIFLQVVINLGGVLGLLPLTGVTLPFLSYGGSSMLVVCVAIGLLLNISMRRYLF